MDQLRKLLQALSVPQRIGILTAVACLIGALVGFVHWRHESDFRTLFTGMAPEDAAAIVQKLKESGVEHRLSDSGGSVLVPAAQVNELRLEMAGAGLPKTGRVGFELFDKTNLGITDFTEHVNYRRALEGELERSVRSLAEVQQARIHISFPKDSVFLDSREPAKASVLVDLRAGARLSEQNVLAITNLVASAVEGLSPDFVSVVDMRGNLLSRPKKMNGDAADSSDAALEYKHQVERDLMMKVQSTLAPLLGEDHFRVGISADCDFTTSEQTEEVFDPTRSVMTNSQKSEDMAGGTQVAGVPGTPSNLPRPATPPPSRSGSGVSRRSENVAYETSRTVRQVKVPKGAIKRISASLLLDQDVHWEGKGNHAKRVIVPPSPDKLKSIHDIVAGVLGLAPDRGDQLIVQSLPFETHLDEFSSPETGKPSEDTNPTHKLMHDPRILIGAGVTALLLVGLVVFVLARKSRKSVVSVKTTASLPAAASEEKTSVLGDGNAEKEKAQLNGHIQQRPQLPDPALKIEALRQSLRESVNRDPVLVASVLRGWIDEDDR